MNDQPFVQSSPIDVHRTTYEDHVEIWHVIGYSGAHDIGLNPDLTVGELRRLLTLGLQVPAYERKLERIDDWLDGKGYHNGLSAFDSDD